MGPPETPAHQPYWCLLLTESSILIRTALPAGCRYCTASTSKGSILT